LSLLDVGGRFGRELAAEGGPAMIAFAGDWLANLFGADIKKAIKRTNATQWNQEPFVLGAFSAAAPGGQPSRRILAEPLGNKIWFAGEAVHETLWGTVGGAWESGERTAETVLRRLGVLKEPEPATRPPPKGPPKKSPRRRYRLTWSYSFVRYDGGSATESPRLLYPKLAACPRGRRHNIAPTRRIAVQDRPRNCAGGKLMVSGTQALTGAERSVATRATRRRSSCRPRPRSCRRARRSLRRSWSCRAAAT
jgi:Flavin containing amine oxidoreductase